MNDPIAISITDLHLSLQQPACRADKDWRKVQANYLQQVQKLALELGNVPVMCAGDIFDRWNPSPELINFALEYLPDGMICVPGQHDLPNHRIEDINRCGYGVLVKAKKIIDVSDTYHETKNFIVFGFGWNQPVKPCKRIGKKPHIALLHKYLFLNSKSSFPGAPETCNVSSMKKILCTYDSVIVGDNHKAWFL